MLLKFIEKRFRQPSLDLIEQANQICERYARQGQKLTVRQLHYQFVSRDLYANTMANYNKLKSVMSDARDAGMSHWDFIEDRGRRIEENSHWESPREAMDAIIDQFKIDTWADQPNVIFVMVEKQALEGFLLPTCLGLDIPFIANKGYSSASSMFKIGRRLRDAFHNGQVPHVIYLGDHDPSGMDMTRDIDHRLNLYAFKNVTGLRARSFNQNGAPSRVVVHRIALNMDQVDEYDPPENFAKLTDPRIGGYLDEFGESSWELDALEPSVMIDLIEDKVAELRDDDIFDARVEEQERLRLLIKAAADEYFPEDEPEPVIKPPRYTVARTLKDELDDCTNAVDKALKELEDDE